MLLSRDLQRAAFDLADGDVRVAQRPCRCNALAQVAAVQAGAATGGTALVTLSWDGEDVVASGYANTYTPVVGHWVICHVIRDQPFIAYAVVGQPIIPEDEDA